jgi:hypothetical protein
MLHDHRRAGAIETTPIDFVFAAEAKGEGFRRMVGATVRGTRNFNQNRNKPVQMLADYLRISRAQSAKAYDPRSILFPMTA